MAYRAALLNFTKGEISPDLESRFDLPAYQAGLRKATNVRIRRTGGVIKRMGTRLVAEALDPDARLVPFQFNDEQAYALEMGQGYMRPFALGGAVLETDYKVQSITKEPQAIIEITLHGYSVGDLIYLKSDDPDTFGMVEILDRFLEVVAVPDADHVQVNIDSTNFTTFGSDVGTVNAVPPAAPPPPPVVPPPATPPPPPVVGGSSGGGYVDDGSGGGRWKGDEGGSVSLP